MARFLVVDDEVNTVTALRELLEMDGHEVVASSSCREAVNALAHVPFDAVLTDLEMTWSRGENVVRLARERHPTA
jgi:CheY-like chemotaxis protein